jgi:DNA-binding protein Fis
MKTEITINQWNEIPREIKSAWFDWSVRHGYATEISRVKKEGINQLVVSEMEVPTINQMLQFLYDRERRGRSMFGIQWALDDEKKCDRLWEIVKKQLLYIDEP